MGSSSVARADTQYVLALLLQQLLCCWIEQRKSNRAHSTLLLQSYVCATKSFKNWYLYSCSKNTLGYSTRNHKFKRLEPHCQLSATRSASKEGTETAIAWPHSRECTKEPISSLPNYGSKKKFGASAELRNVPQEKLRGKRWFQLSIWYQIRQKKSKKMWAMQHRYLPHQREMFGLASAAPTIVRLVHLKPPYMGSSSVATVEWFLSLDKCFPKSATSIVARVR